MNCNNNQQPGLSCSQSWCDCQRTLAASECVFMLICRVMLHKTVPRVFELWWRGSQCKGTARLSASFFTSTCLWIFKIKLFTNFVTLAFHSLQKLKNLSFFILCFSPSFLSTPCFSPDITGASSSHHCALDSCVQEWVTPWATLLNSFDFSLWFHCYLIFHTWTPLKVGTQWTQIFSTHY